MSIMPEFWTEGGIYFDNKNYLLFQVLSIEYRYKSNEEVELNTDYQRLRDNDFLEITSILITSPTSAYYRCIVKKEKNSIELINSVGNKLKVLGAIKTLRKLNRDNFYQIQYKNIELLQINSVRIEDINLDKQNILKKGIVLNEYYVNNVVVDYSSKEPARKRQFVKVYQATEKPINAVLWQKNDVLDKIEVFGMTHFDYIMKLYT